MFMVEIAGLKILFTGDYSREDDRHLVCAEVPPVKPDILICESTYGTASHMPRLEKEARLMKLTTEILTRGGRVLMPVFALGMAQELLLILDEYWEKYPKFQTYPIYYASNLARKCMDVYRTYINTMNDKIKRAMFEGEGRNPWDFRWVRSLKNIERFDDVGGCVMLASPGMLQVGTPLVPLGIYCSQCLVFSSSGFAAAVVMSGGESLWHSVFFFLYSVLLFRVENHVCVNEEYTCSNPQIIRPLKFVKIHTDQHGRTAFPASSWSDGHRIHGMVSSSPVIRSKGLWLSKLSRSQRKFLR